METLKVRENVRGRTGSTYMHAQVRIAGYHLYTTTSYLPRACLSVCCLCARMPIQQLQKQGCVQYFQSPPTQKKKKQQQGIVAMIEYFTEEIVA